MMRWDVCNFFQNYRNDIPKDEQGVYQWGCDELKRLLTEAATMAQEAGNTELVEGFWNLNVKPRQEAVNDGEKE